MDTTSPSQDAVPDGSDQSAAPTISQRESDTGGGCLEVRCPSCRAPMEVAVDTRLTDLTCSACGSHFSLVDQSKATQMAPSLSKMGRFELIERLGVGGFGTVWKARDKELDRTVAVKVPRAGGMTGEEQEKFFREARAAAQLRHPNIVSVHEVGRDGDNVYIVSDFVRGVTLGDWLTGQQLTSREAAELCSKIADALHHAHEKGVVHRDLKPANIMMDADGEPHLMDFGLALREAGEVTVTMDGQVLGTPAYMSPEQAEGKAHGADRRSDVYSLGVILFQLLTGELPFRGNARMLIHQVINDLPPSPRKLNGNIARDLETTTLKCLDKDPNRRYQTAADFAADLRHFLKGEPIRARPLGGIERAWRLAKRRPAVASLAFLLIAISVVAPLVAVQQALLRIQRDNLATQRALALEQLDRKNEELQNQLADNLFERASVERDAGRVPQAIAILAKAYEVSTPSNPLRESFRNLLAGWSADAPLPLIHDNTVRSVAFNSDGSRVATGGYDNTAIVWDSKTQEIVTGPFQHPAGVRSLVFTPDDALLLTGCEDGLARLWNIARKELASQLKHGAGVRAVAISSDGHIVATAGDDGVVRLWDVATKSQIGDLTGHTSTIRAVCISPDGKTVATGGEDRTARLWDRETRTLKGKPIEARGPVHSMAFSPDGSEITVGVWNRPTLVWDTQTGKKLRVMPTVGSVYTVAYSPDGDTTYLGTLDGFVHSFDTSNLNSVGAPLRQHGPALGLAVAPDGKSLITASTDGMARIWDLSKSGKPPTTDEASVETVVAYDATGRVTLALRGQTLARFWRTDTAKPFGRAIEFEERLQQAVFSPGGSAMLSHCGAAKFQLWDVPQGTALGQPNIVERAIAGILFDDESQPLVAVYAKSDDGQVNLNEIELLDYHTKNVVAKIKQPKPVDGFIYHPGASHVATKSRDLSVRFWSTKTWELVEGDCQVNSGILCWSQSPRGDLLMLGCNDPVASIFAVPTGKTVTEIANAGPVINAIAFSPDGRNVLTSSTRSGIRLWDVDTGKMLRDLTRHDHSLNTVAFSPNNKAIFAKSGRSWSSWPTTPPPLPDDAALIAAWAKARSGMVLDQQRTPRGMSQAEWLAAHEELKRLRGASHLP